MEGGTGERTRPLGLALFGGLFAALFIVMAASVGFDSPGVPANDAVVVEGAPSGTGVITRNEVRRALIQSAARARSEVPKPGSGEYEAMVTRVLSELVSAIWLAGQAEELNLAIPRRGGFPDISRLQKEIEPRLVELAPDPSNPQPYFTEIDRRFLWKWLPRTRCGAGFVFELCGNYAGGHPRASCYEAAPKEPVEACPPPVYQRPVLVPGSVSKREPEGRKLPQGPNSA